MKKVFFKGIIILLFIPINLIAQTKNDDPVILAIDNQNITKSEFLRIFIKTIPKTILITKVFENIWICLLIIN